MDIHKILKFTRTYKGIFNERISTWLFKRYIKNRIHTGITHFEKEDIAIHFSSKEYIERRVWMTGEYETEIQKVFQTYVPSAGNILDIGANIGINSIRLSKLLKHDGRVYSFEPIPYNQKRFSQNIQLNGIKNIELIPYALGDSNQSMHIKFDENEENKGAISLMNADINGLIVDVLKGDDWVKNNRIEAIKFMKIDVEGFEWNVIEGLKETIKINHPTILIEWDLNYQKKSNQSDISNWQNFIENNKYKIYQIFPYELKLLNNMNQAIDGNLLFL